MYLNIFKKNTLKNNLYHYLKHSLLFIINLRTKCVLGMQLKY
jgi:hypothetical protein